MYISAYIIVQSLQITHLLYNNNKLTLCGNSHYVVTHSLHKTGRLLNRHRRDLSELISLNSAQQRARDQCCVQMIRAGDVAGHGCTCTATKLVPLLLEWRVRSLANSMQLVNVSQSQLHSQLEHKVWQFAIFPSTCNLYFNLISLQYHSGYCR